MPSPVLSVTSPHLISLQFQTLQPRWYSLFSRAHGLLQGTDPTCPQPLPHANLGIPVITVQHQLGLDDTVVSQHHISQISDPAAKKVAEKRPVSFETKNQQKQASSKGRQASLFNTVITTVFFSPKLALISCTNIGREVKHLCQQQAGNRLHSPPTSKRFKDVSTQGDAISKLGPSSLHPSR